MQDEKDSSLQSSLFEVLSGQGSVDKYREALSTAQSEGAHTERSRAAESTQEGSTENKPGTRIYGFDTNALIKLSSQDDLALVDLIRDCGAQLIIPRQAIIEFWNNPNASERNEYFQLKRSLETLGSSRYLDDYSSPIKDMIEFVTGAIDSLPEEKKDTPSPRYLFIKTLSQLRNVLIPCVDRAKFHTLAEARLQAKWPPGFMDENKGKPLGDFFVWADFLYGAKSLSSSGKQIESITFVTEEKKKDWRVGGRIHPLLEMESTLFLDKPVSFAYTDAFLREIKK